MGWGMDCVTKCAILFWEESEMEVSQEWFWVQCNIFIGASLEIGLTCGGGLKQFLELKETFENDAAHSMDVKRLCGFATSICKATFTFWWVLSWRYGIFWRRHVFPGGSMCWGIPWTTNASRKYGILASFGKMPSLTAPCFYLLQPAVALHGYQVLKGLVNHLSKKTYGIVANIQVSTEVCSEEIRFLHSEAQTYHVRKERFLEKKCVQNI